MIVIGDIHGCFDTFMALLKQLPDVQKVIVGDLVDRGPKSKETVQWVMDHKDECISVMGNHEHAFLDIADGHYTYSYRDWYKMGGKQTLSSYGISEYDKVIIPEDHYHFLSNLPIYLEYDDFIVTHAAFSQIVSFEEIIKYPGYFDGLLWYRGKSRKIKNKFHIHGHTPLRKPYITEDFAAIDTGCVYDEGKFLTAIEYPSMKIYQQERVESATGW